MNKTLLSAYESTPIAAFDLCSIGTVSDFKEIARYRLLGTGGFEKVAPDGELKHGKLSDQKYSNKVDTYGQILALTRHDIINDDLNAFMDIPRQMGRSGAESIDDLFFTLLYKRGWNNKLWQSKKGLPKGGRQFDKCSVHALLTNPIYSGKIKHKTDLYQGQHQAIVDEEIFERVQAQLRENGFNRGNRMPSKHGGLLKGLIRCPNCNVAMVHNMTKRNSIVYRYYTCVRAIKRGRQACKHPSLPAGEIEAAVVDQVRDISRDAGLRDEIIRQLAHRT